MESSDRYQSPLQARYASRPMQELWSDRNRFTTWRRLWLALARGSRRWASTSPTNRSPRWKRIWTISIWKPPEPTRPSFDTT